MLTDEELRVVIQDNLDLLDDPQKAVKLLYKVAKAQEKQTLKEVGERLQELDWYSTGKMIEALKRGELPEVRK